MTAESRVIKIYESFILGFCKCGCSTEISIRSKHRKELKLYQKGHGQKGRMGRMSNGYKNGISYSGNYKLLYRPHHKYALSNGYILEHRYIMELQLGRYLTKKEVVHHRDENPKNNVLSNLELLDGQGNHMSIHNPKLDMSGRWCSKCSSIVTYVEKSTNRPHWHYYEYGLLCQKCYDKERNKIN